MKQSHPARDWVFTVNNPQSKDIEKVLNFDYKYLVFQVELGEEGTPHVQGFVQFHERLRLSGLKKLHKKAHWEKRRGTPYEASHYCKKPDLENGCDCPHCKDLERFDSNPAFEEGMISCENQYKTHEIARVIKAKGLSHTIERFPEAYLVMHSGMEKLETFYSPKRDWITTVTVCWGEPDAGKTRYAMHGPCPYKLAAFGGANSTDFFGDYRPREHETLVVDDFYGNWKYTTFLQVADRYPTEVHTKGGFRQLLIRHLVFTSNSSPDKWYPKVLLDLDRRESFFRRIHNIIHFTKAGYAISKVGFTLMIREVFHGLPFHG